MGDHSQVGVYQRMLERERRARLAAEQLLEKKSLELYEANEGLQEALRRQRREAFNQRVILGSVADGILAVSSGGNVESANPGACKILGHPPGELVGHSVSEFISLAETSELPSASNHFFADYCTAKHPVIEVLGRSADGGSLTLELSASYGEISEGVDDEPRDADVLIIWVFRDVSYINAVKRRSDLSRRLEGIGELAAGIAHEINTPIQFVFENTKFFGEAYQALNGVLQCYEEHAHAEGKTPERLGEMCPPDQIAFYRTEVPNAIEEAKAGAWRIGEIVAAVKEFSHAGAEEYSLANLNDLVGTAITITSNNCKHVANVRTVLFENLPLVSCLRGQIIQVLVNLIVNAADAITESRGAGQNHVGEITIETGTDADSVFFSVQDTGVGMDVDLCERIFLPFFTTKDVGKGTGQGLAITHAIVVENHGGSVDVESEVGKGTRFIVQLPIESQ